MNVELAFLNSNEAKNVTWPITSSARLLKHEKEASFGATIFKVYSAKFFVAIIYIKEHKEHCKETPRRR